MKQKNIFLMRKKIEKFLIFTKRTYSLSTIIEALEKDPSILNIIKRNLDPVFPVSKTTQEEVSKVIRDLNTDKKKIK